MAAWRWKLHEIIFEADTPVGKAFDVALLLSISLSVLVVMLDSMPDIRASHRSALVALEWLFTLLFTLEYALRIASVRRPWRYITSFFGVIDLLSILPTYLSLFIPGSQYLTVVRILRMLRVFRILKLAQYLQAAQTLRLALRASQQKITVFLLTVVSLVVIVGSLMYVIEGEAAGFTDIPTSIYWAIVTMTTVGYGDIAPITPLGKTLASVVMLLGYGIIAVPTGIVTVELSRAKSPETISTQVCPHCGREGHDADAIFCKYCGEKLNV